MHFLAGLVLQTNLSNVCWTKEEIGSHSHYADRIVLYSSPFQMCRINVRLTIENWQMADDQTRQNAFGIQFWTWWIFDLEIFFLSFDSGLDQNWQVTGHVWGDRGPFLKLILLQKFPCGCKMIFWFWEAVSNYQSISYNFKAC